MSVQVFAIVLDWNGLEDTLACVESLQGLAIGDGDPNSQLTVVVVDNGSRQSPCQSLADRYPDVVCLETGINLGYAGGNNFGISYALDRGADFVWVLNNDAVVDPGCLATLLQTFARADRVALPPGKHFTEEAHRYFRGFVSCAYGALAGTMASRPSPCPAAQRHSQRRKAALVLGRPHT